jgi:hypothetical protein
MRAFLLQGLSDPNDDQYRERMKRFAAMYMGEDPEAPNYDPVNKVIKSIWNGSKGPMLRKATTYDWVGDPVPGTFHLLHNPAGRGKMLDLNAHYKKMLAHCDEYLDSAGDNFLNLAATILGLNAYMLTGEEKYRNWVLEYVNAWKQRTEETGGNIPSNVGLNGKPGGEHSGQWWKGTYGWNFTIFDGELEQIAIATTSLTERGPASATRCCSAEIRDTWACSGGRWTISSRRRKWRTEESCCRKCTVILAGTSTTVRRAGITTRAICGPTG